MNKVISMKKHCERFIEKCNNGHVMDDKEFKKYQKAKNFLIMFETRKLQNTGKSEDSFMDIFTFGGKKWLS